MYKVISLTHKIKGHKHNHSFTSPHSQSHLQPRSVSHAHFRLTESQFSSDTFWSETTGTTNSYHHLYASVLLSCSSLLHAVKLNQSAVWPPTDYHSILEPKNTTMTILKEKLRLVVIVD